MSTAVRSSAMNSTSLPLRSEQTLQMARDIGDRLIEGQVLGNLGNTYVELNEPRRALECYEQHLATAREIGYRSGEANALFNSALTLNELGDRIEAIARVEIALKIYEGIESPSAVQARAALAQWRSEQQ